MRATLILALAAFAALPLAGCNGEQAATNAATGDEEVAVEQIGSNDMTAIDAATNEAANMAADMDLANLPANDVEGNDSDDESNSAGNASDR